MLDCRYRASTGRCLAIDAINKGYMGACKYLANGDCMGPSRLKAHSMTCSLLRHCGKCDSRCAAAQCNLQWRCGSYNILNCAQHCNKPIWKMENDIPKLPKNTWLIPAQVENAGIIGPVAAIYKFYRAERDEFTFVLKSMQEFDHAKDNVLSLQLRLVALMLVDIKAIVDALPTPKIIEGLGVETYYDDDLKL